VTATTAMRSRSAYEQRNSLVQYLASQLVRGRLALILGAGASAGFGLPGWSDLLLRICGAARIRPPKGNLTQMAETLESKIGDREKFVRTLHKCLYRGTSSSAVIDSELLRAVGSVVMALSRRGVGEVITFNFDDILERHLRQNGFAVDSVCSLPDWFGNCDARIYHPHGSLPAATRVDKAQAESVVITQADYDRIVDKGDSPWNELLLTVMRSRTCLFIGLSGQDQNVCSLLSNVGSSHATKRTREAYWGIRFGLDKPPVSDAPETMWTKRKVFAAHVKSYGDLPGLLLEVCQLAATMRLHP
jgi:hypothetical protein